MKTLIATFAMFTMFAATSGVAFAGHFDLQSCFEDAAIESLAQDTQRDAMEIRQMTSRTQGIQDLIVAMREVAVDLESNGYDKSTALRLTRGGLTASPTLAREIGSCITRYL